MLKRQDSRDPSKQFAEEHGKTPHLTWLDLVLMIFKVDNGFPEQPFLASL